MKQTAVEKMIEYFIEQKSNGVSHWCIEDLLAQLYQALEIEKQQIIDAFEYVDFNIDDGLHYYEQNFKLE